MISQFSTRAVELLSKKNPSLHLTIQDGITERDESQQLGILCDVAIDFRFSAVRRWKCNPSAEPRAGFQLRCMGWTFKRTRDLLTLREMAS